MAPSYLGPARGGHRGMSWSELLPLWWINKLVQLPDRMRQQSRMNPEKVVVATQKPIASPMCSDVGIPTGLLLLPLYCSCCHHPLVVTKGACNVAPHCLYRHGSSCVADTEGDEVGHRVKLTEEPRRLLLVFIFHLGQGAALGTSRPAFSGLFQIVMAVSAIFAWGFDGKPTWADCQLRR